MFTFLSKEDIRVLEVQSIGGNGLVGAGIRCRRAKARVSPNFLWTQGGRITVRPIRQVLAGEELHCRLNSEQYSAMRD